ncbi:glucose-1-phosphate adenylyltransferase [Pelosinus sp. IPA-1]|uniref:glucose-1-phosphate adenylyltransferase n=1 Tax=Pelosinus sp. IPA-1 TaxID=3029569 RepID=UPI00243616C2|nr:glucose-1-phosphate adenylyltransferase [Pelosinus sp. IPA-1]GMB01457.1 glucose-1-phosphate adenylyltransferase [Pelosinus sp. IPA-1]
MHKKKCVAMLLAGGQGSRLGILTQKVAKPAVPFGGKYRIIDFPLSNCNNSGIDTVGVLTQYKPLALNGYIGIGSAWDLDRMNGGVYVLPPFVKEQGGEWYKGTADAICQNINFIEGFNPEYVLILSGDHIYKMDYSLMLEFHQEKQADATIAVIEVSWEEASRFGIMNTDGDNRIIEFDEKPAEPKSNLASMGIYIFSWALLKKYLAEDEKDLNSTHDFGHDIIPKMLADKRNLTAYPFKGYWKDVGTVESYWQANMDLLGAESELNMYDPKWRIYSANPPRPPHYTSATAKVRNSIISEGCLVLGEVENSVIFRDVYIGEGAKIKDSIIMSSVHVEDNVVIDKAIIGRKTVLKQGSIVAADQIAGEQEIVVLDADMMIPPHTKVVGSISCILTDDDMCKRGE